MKKLTRDQLARKTKLAAQLQLNGNALSDAITKCNAAIASAFAIIEAPLEAYNAVCQDASEFVDEITAAMESYQEDRSEKWQESDAGQSYQAWLDSWREITELLEEVIIETPQEVEDPELSGADVLLDLQDEVDGV